MIRLFLLFIVIAKTTSATTDSKNGRVRVASEATAFFSAGGVAAECPASVLSPLLLLAPPSCVPLDVTSGHAVLGLFRDSPYLKTTAMWGHAEFMSNDLGAKWTRVVRFRRLQKGVFLELEQR